MLVVDDGSTDDTAGAYPRHRRPVPAPACQRRQGRGAQGRHRRSAERPARPARRDLRLHPHRRRRRPAQPRRHAALRVAGGARARRLRHRRAQRQGHAAEEQDRQLLLAPRLLPRHRPLRRRHAVRLPALFALARRSAADDGELAAIRDRSRDPDQGRLARLHRRDGRDSDHLLRPEPPHALRPAVGLDARRRGPQPLRALVAGGHGGRLQRLRAAPPLRLRRRRQGQHHGARVRGRRALRAQPRVRVPGAGPVPDVGGRALRRHRRRQPGVDDLAAAHLPARRRGADSGEDPRAAGWLFVHVRGTRSLRVQGSARRAHQLGGVLPAPLPGVEVVARHHEQHAARPDQAVRAAARSRCRCWSWAAATPASSTA